MVFHSNALSWSWNEIWLGLQLASPRSRAATMCCGVVFLGLHPNDWCRVQSTLLLTSTVRVAGLRKTIGLYLCWMNTRLWGLFDNGLPALNLHLIPNHSQSILIQGSYEGYLFLGDSLKKHRQADPPPPHHHPGWDTLEILHLWMPLYSHPLIFPDDIFPSLRYWRACNWMQWHFRTAWMRHYSCCALVLFTVPKRNCPSA